MRTNAEETLKNRVRESRSVIQNGVRYLGTEARSGEYDPEEYHSYKIIYRRF